MRLKDISYYQTGGTCDQIASPETLRELANLVRRLEQQHTDFFLLGAGSNSLIMDDHWPWTVITFNRMDDITVEGNRIRAAAGVDNSTLANACRQAGLTGAEWLYGLPGQIGATTRMNARCYGGEISGIVDTVLAVTPSGEIKTYQGDNVFQGYKDTVFMGNHEIIAEIEMALQPGETESINQKMASCLSDRRQKHQFLHPSCGCVFKNDYTAGVPSGLLLEKSGVRRFSTAQVEISPYHANFVFNRGAPALEILEVTLKMREAVYREFGVWLDYEMEILGRIPDDYFVRFKEIRPQNYRLDRLESMRQTADIHISANR